MERLPALDVTPPAPDGVCEIVHMGHEISNQRGIFGGFKLPKIPILVAGSSVLNAEQEWAEMIPFCFRHLLPYIVRVSVSLPPPHLTSPYVSLSKIMRKEKFLGCYCRITMHSLLKMLFL